MSKYTPKANNISIFTNSKRTKDTQPTLNGKVCIPIDDYQEIVQYIEDNGVQKPVIVLDISLWSKKSTEGVVYWSGQVKKPFVRQDENVSDLPPHDSEIPFVSSEDMGSNTGTPPDNDLPF